MMMEAAYMSGALLVIRPNEVISFKGLSTFILAATAYLGLSTFYRLVSVKEITSQVVIDNITKYVLTYNYVAILYAFAFGAIINGLIKLATAKQWNFSKVKQIIYHPAFASSMAAIALVVTLVLR